MFSSTPRCLKRLPRLRVDLQVRLQLALETVRGLVHRPLRLAVEGRDPSVDPRLHERQLVRIEVMAAAVLVVLDVEPGRLEARARVAGEVDDDDRVAAAVGDEDRQAARARARAPSRRPSG